jgi:hypothetical protein
LASAAVAKRRASGSTTKIAAKQRRQKVFVVVLAVVFAALLVYQVPRTLKLVGKSGSPPATAVAVPSTAASAQASTHVAKQLRGSGNGADPFAARGVSNTDSRPAAADRPDPFTAPVPATPAATAPTPAALPQKIVIGRPGGNRVARHGFIVILASIPTRNGRNDAISFARGARRNVGVLSILNSSHSRPLRGGYWVVYSGPYPTLGKVSASAGSIHAAGYRTAYIRELIAYK